MVKKALPKAPIKSKGLLEKVGQFSFIIGVSLAIVAGLFSRYVNTEALVTTLFILGCIVGVLNITVKETTRFLVATIALILAGVVNLRLVRYIGAIVGDILTNVVVFVVPAALIVGLRAIWLLAKEK